MRIQAGNACILDTTYVHRTLRQCLSVLYSDQIPLHIYLLEQYSGRSAPRIFLHTCIHTPTHSTGCRNLNPYPNLGSGPPLAAPKPKRPLPEDAAAPALGLGLKLLGLGVLGFRVWGFRFLGFWVVGFWVEGFRVSGFGLRVLGFRVEGLGF